MKTLLSISGLFIVLLTAAPAFSGGWLIYHDGPYEGKVVDAETGEPIEGAAVVGVWYLDRYGGVGGAVPKFFDAKETMTNKDGEFEIASVTGFHWWPLAKLDRPEFVAFKPGYSGYPSMKNKWYFEKQGTNLIKLKKTGTRKERIKAFFMIDACGPDVRDPAILESCIPINKVKNIIDLMEEEARNLGLL